MGQNMNINIDNANMAGKAVNAYSKDKASDILDASLSSKDSSSNYIFDGTPSTQTKVNKTMDQFEEYLKNQQEKAKESGEDEASQEKADKEAAKEIRNNLSSEEIKQLAMMGVDVESARLSDLMGMVNTMRGKNHREETQELFAQIKANSGDVENLVVTGDGVKVAGTDVSVDNVSVTDVSEDKKTADVNFVPGKNELAYLVRNDLSLNRENLYKAHFSGIKLENNAMDDEVFDTMKKQIAEIIDESGIDNFDMDDARFLLDNELPISSDAMKLVAQYKQIEGQDINSVKLPENDDESVELAAQELYKKVLFVEPETVEEMAEEFAVSGKEVSIQAAYARQLEKTTTGINDNKDDKDDKTVKSVKTNVKKADTDVKTEDIKKTAFLVEGMTPAGITAKRQLLEIQLSMTLQVANRMARLDINVDTKGLSETLDVLRQAEREVLKENLANSGVEPVDENADILSETIAGVESLSNADATVLAAPLRGGEFTVRGLNAMADLMSDEVDYNTTETTQAGQNLRRSFETVKRSYEAVETTPRSDMGDSITKAFSNIDELLGELDIDVNYETRRAAKILGYNSMEITQENVDGIISYDREVNRLLDNFYPEAVMGLIKDGINPMDIPIDELNDVISSKNYNNGVTEARNFATYLRDVEKRGEISDDERESYIGLYRVMDKLEKSGDREAGFVFANQANLTIRNMISAMRSRRAKGLDVNIDDSFGMLESLLSSGTGMDEQIEAGFSFGSGLNQEEAPEDIVERYRQTDEDVEWFIQENGIEYNMGNAIAVDALLNEEEGVYKLIYEALSRMKFSDTTEENLVDEETGNMAASMLGEDVDVDISEALDTEQLLRQLGENGDLSLTYEDIRNQLTELMYDAGAAGRITSLDISAIKSATAGVNLLGQMAKNDRYQIPVETGQGTTVVNITLKNAAGNGKVSDTGSDALQATVIEAYTKTEAAGNLTARLELTAYGDDSITVKGEFLSDSSAGNEALNNMQGVEAAFEERLKGVFSGMNISSDVKFGTVAGRENSGVEYTGEAKQPSRGVSCRVAVEAVRTIMELEKSWS